ncbi:MAG: MBL fold metallo-hydrolase [Bacteroidaceae bacterium]|nr:MBL fold metallo-hydrolase [Bacteroidaceae bacterium]
MVGVHDITNTIFTSKTYVLYKEDDRKEAWLIDIGDIEPVIEFLNRHNLSVEGVFLTHGHFDHIYGLNSLVEAFPDCKVYATEYTKQAIASDKLNMSRYHETPFTYQGANVVVVSDSENMYLFDDEPPMAFYETPGHNPGCLTMVIGDLIFTGDAYIPGVKVNTILPHADKELAKQSLDKILKLAEGRRVLAGHWVK